MRHLNILAVTLLLAAVACSSPDRARRGASPVAPTAAAVDTTPMGVGGIAGPMDILFPSRADAFQFRNELEVKYQTGLNRPPSFSHVDREGDVVWVQEYIRYRVNYCDHATAVARVMAQIDGQPPGGLCGENRDFVIIFPPRDETMDFRRQLEAKYQSMGRPLQSSFVDMEGSVIWTQEYMRYRVNQCSHTQAVEKVFAQIDGAPPSATCGPTCAYRPGPGARNLTAAQQDSYVDLFGEPGGCGWTATSDAPWLIIPEDYRHGRNGLTIPYTVLQNVSGGPRTGRITIDWDGGGTSVHTVFQDGNELITTFTMTDSFRSGNTPTTECHFRSTATPCTLTATSNLPGNTYSFKWTVSYSYGATIKTTTLESPAVGAVYTITDACGAPDAAAGGADSPLMVEMTIIDNLGNTQTIRSGEGMQPALKVVKHPC
jgi:hypothetical protein